MTIKEQIKKLAVEKASPCITISLNTHRTHPDSLMDEIKLKNLLREAENRIVQDYKKRDVVPLLDKIKEVENEINRKLLLDSLHIFLSNNTKEIVKLSVSTRDDIVYMDDHFHVNPLIKAYNRIEEYYILLLSQGGVYLYKALNDIVEEEIENENFPFDETPYYVEPERKGDSKYSDDLVKEFFNKVDKALVKLYNQTELETIVVCTEDNYSRFMQVADKPQMYIAHAFVDYNNIASHHVAKQAWEKIQTIQREKRTHAIEEVKDAVSQSNVLTDLNEIYQAAIDGKADLLIANEDFVQPVKMINKRTFEFTNDVNDIDTIDDITSVIAWDVISKGGRVVFTKQEELLELGNIVLKTRY